MIKYICDKCRKEVQPEELFEITLKTCFGGEAPAEVAKMAEDKHICRRCLSYIFRANGGPVFQEKEKELDEDGHFIAKKAEHIETPAERDRKKTYFVNKANFDKIQELYKAGKEMVDISDELGVAVSAVSKVIMETGLGAERYKGKYIPSEGGAPIPHALPIVTKKATG